MTAPTFNDVAERLADDDPPEWLVQALGWFARLIGGQRSDDGELEIIDQRLFASAKYLQGTYLLHQW
jgi:hypothetical protein